MLCVRWYLRYPLSYRDLEEMMCERGLHIDHTTIYRWVQHFAPELEKRCRPHLNATNDSWRVDETYVKVKKVWMYLYRAVDSEGNTLELLLSPRRDTEAAKRFFSKALAAPHISPPRVITVDKNAAYWGLRLIAWIQTTLGSVVVIPWNPKRQKNRSCLPPTWAKAELSKRGAIERFFGRVFLFFH